MPVLAVSEQQLDAIMAGLRLLQQAHLAGGIEGDILDIFTHEGDHPGLYPKEIDALCEGINGGDQDVTIDNAAASRSANKLAVAVEVALAREDEIVVTTDGDDVIVNMDLRRPANVKAVSECFMDALDAVSRIGRPKLVPDGK